MEKQPIVTTRFKESEITLLGTAHVSQASVDAVHELSKENNYDMIAVELCDARYQAMMNPDGLAEMDLFRVIREGKAALVAGQLAMGAYQTRLAEQFGIEPGAEQKAAIAQAKQQNAELLIIDRDIGITLKRAVSGLSWIEKVGVVGGLLASVVSREDVTEDDVEALKQGDMLESAFSDFAEDRSALFAVLIAERDRYMAAQLQKAATEHPGKSILAVVGAGHLKGIEATLQEPLDAEVEISRLNELKQKRSWLRYLPWLIVALVLTGFAIGFSRSPDIGWQMVIDWVWINGSLSALGALIAGGHPLTVLTAFLAAPLTSLNPTIGAGMVTAGAEIYFRKPKVKDFHALRVDTMHWKGWWKNRVSRTLLVFLFSTLGSAAGTWLAGFRIADLLT